jgi:hypothetical protein
MIIGVEKGGSEALNDIFIHHRNKAFCAPSLPSKEINFFSDTEIYRKGFQWYAGLYHGCKGRYWIDASENYLENSKVLPLLYSHYSNNLKRHHEATSEAVIFELITEPLSFLGKGTDDLNILF